MPVTCVQPTIFVARRSCVSSTCFSPISPPRLMAVDWLAAAASRQSMPVPRKFPSISADEFGTAILEETDKDGTVSARDIGEDFLAATLENKGSPDAPTVFLPTEEKFYNYSSGDG